MISWSGKGSRKQSRVSRAVSFSVATAMLVLVATPAPAPIRTGQRPAEGMPGGIAARRFTLTDKEQDTFTQSCVEAARGQGSPQLIARQCGCLTQTLQWSVSRKEFDDYTGWLVWRSSWRRNLWHEDEPRGVAAAIQRDAAMCRS